ncbi:MAG: type II toxin-antitoxin system RelE/ParE family toxin [Actinomycetota bacterium]|nr:type II toxin-antitoxin system RelE/ParE family toxin [Actinomycetota bacterium]
MAEVRLSRRAVKDLDALTKSRARNLVDAIEKLGANPSDPQLDIKVLMGHRPWRRLRVGNHRVLFRMADGQKVLIVGRVIDRKELAQAAQSLD